MAVWSLSMLLIPVVFESSVEPPPFVGWVEGVQRWLTQVMSWLPQAAGVAWSRWPWLAAALAVYVTVRVVVFGLRLRLWPRVIAAGYWAKVTPPREVDPALSESVWRSLHALARRAAGSRWRLVRPPLVLEVLGHPDGRVEIGLWLPAWVPFAWAAAELEQCWPGSRVTGEPVPMPPAADSRGGVALAGLRLAAREAQSRWLVDDPRPGSWSRADAGMGTVLRAVGQRDGTTWVQVVARLPGRRDLRWQRASATQVEVPPRWQSPTLGVALRGLQRLARSLLGLLEFFLTSSSQPARRTAGAGKPTPTPWQRERMKEAGDKLAAGPHLLVSVRVLAVRGSRREAADAAKLAAAGFAITSRRLGVESLWLPGWVVGNRWAWPAHWLLLSATELAVLVHLPADPARYGFDTAAEHRTPPPHAARPGTGAPPNPPPARQPGWSARDRQHQQPDPAPAARPETRSWPDHPDDEEGGDDDEYPPQ